MTLLHPWGDSEAGATEQRDPVRLSQGIAPLLQAAVVLDAAASAKPRSAPAERNAAPA